VEGTSRTPFKAFSTNVREPCQWCFKNKNKTFFSQGARLPQQESTASGDKRGKESSECFICKEEGHGLDRAAVCPQAVNFQAMIQQQQGRANLAAH